MLKCTSIECKTKNHIGIYTKNIKQQSEYGTWQNIKTRCTNPKIKDYKYYGGRGIKVSELWSSCYLAFINDMGHKPKGYTIDRINNDGNYEPGNCRWATYKEQASNRRQQSKGVSVFFTSQYGRWEVRYSSIYRKTFSTELAAMAYKYQLELQLGLSSK